MQIKLTDAQASALECRPLDDLPGTFTGRTLEFTDPETMSSWLCDASNAEDAYAEMNRGEEVATYARRAAVSLSCLMGKAWKAR